MRLTFPRIFLLLAIALPTLTLAQEVETGDAVQPPAMTIETDSGTVYTRVETMPEFPGGQTELFKFIAQNTTYPAEAKSNGIEGTVYVNFVVDQNGIVTNVRVLREVDPLLDTEALRVINAMPNWTPGTQDGKPVRVSYNLPMRFKLTDGFKGKGKKKKKKRKQ